MKDLIVADGLPFEFCNVVTYICMHIICSTV